MICRIIVWKKIRNMYIMIIKCNIKIQQYLEMPFRFIKFHKVSLSLGIYNAAIKKVMENI